MAVNKVIYGNDTLIDLTNATALANDVVSGKTFYGKDGILTTGLLAGLTFEEGTYIPEEDTKRGIIYFQNTHSEPPAFFLIADTNNDTLDNSMLTNCYFDFVKWFGNPVVYNTTTPLYAILNMSYRGTASNNASFSNTQITDDSSSDRNTTYKRYWVSNEWFKPGAGAWDYVFKANRTYKWVAIWK